MKPKDKSRSRNLTPKQRELSNSPKKRREESRSPRRRDPSKSPRRRELSKSPRRRELSKSPRRRELSKSPKRRELSGQSSRRREKSPSPKRKEQSRSPRRKEPSRSPRRRDLSRSPRRRRESPRQRDASRSPNKRGGDKNDKNPIEIPAPSRRIDPTAKPPRQKSRFNQSQSPKLTIDLPQKDLKEEQQKKKLPQPIVRLHSSTDSESEDTNPKIDDDLLGIQKPDEKQFLEALSDIAAKAKEKIKTMTEPPLKPTTTKPVARSNSIEIPSLARETTVATAAVSSTNNRLPEPAEKSKINAKPMKINEFKIKGRREMLDQLSREKSKSRSRSKSIGKNDVSVEEIRKDDEGVRTSKSRSASKSS